MSELTSNEETVGPTVFRMDDGILMVSYIPGAVYDLNEAKLFVARRHELLGDARVPFFIDGANLKSMSRDVRDYLASTEGARNAKSVAILANSAVEKVMTTIFMGLHTPLIPTRMFTDKKEALDWLQQYK